MHEFTLYKSCHINHSLPYLYSYFIFFSGASVGSNINNTSAFCACKANNIKLVTNKNNIYVRVHFVWFTMPSFSLLCFVKMGLKF